jgi:RNA polymerase sigma factor (sigma-70 family)
VEGPRLTQSHDAAPTEPLGGRAERAIALSETPRSFDDRFVELFDAHYHRLFRFLDRLSGDPDLAADVAQDAFVRLYGRGSVPDAPGAWLVSVAMNLFRNVQSAKSRRLRLLTPDRGERVHADRAPSPDEGVMAKETQRRVRAAIDRLPERERRMLLLRAEGYSYHEIATSLAISDASIGTLLSRATRAFRQAYGDVHDAP